MMGLYKRLLGGFMQTKIYEYLLKNIIPYIRFTTYYTTLSGKKYHEMYEQLKPGDVILTTDKKKLTSLLIPGEFSHAAFCVSLDKKWETSEMTHEDYRKSCFFDVCKESDRVVILRPNLSSKSILSAIIKCKSFQNTKYDVNFYLGVKALYCSELIYQSFEKNELGVDLSDLVGLGRNYISPDGLYNATNLDVVIDSDLL